MKLGGNSGGVGRIEGEVMKDLIKTFVCAKFSNIK